MFIWFLTKVPEQLNEEKVFLTNGAGRPGFSHEKE
jgi:hypothetical protein